MHVLKKSLECPQASGVLTGYSSCYISHTNPRLTPAQGEALKRLTMGLQMSGARRANGKPIRDGGEAVLWMLDQLAAGEVQAPEPSRLQLIESYVAKALAGIRDLAAAVPA